MLKFFRRIRLKLLSESKLKKYLVYAIGEILLVVFGILIALQVNNWNEDRKNRETEEKVLLAILNNLQEDALTMQKATERFRLTMANIDRLFQPIPIPDDSLAFISTRADGISQFIPITTAFDRSMSSGEFQLIQEDSIAQIIQRLYAFEYKTLEDSDKTLMYIQEKIYAMTPRYDAFDLKPAERKEGLYDQSYLLPWNIEKLKNRNQAPEFKALLKQLYVNISMTIMFYENINQKNERVKTIIQDYLRTF